MAKVGSLFVKLLFDTDGLKIGAKQAKTQISTVDKYTKSASNSIGKSLGKIGGAMAGAFAIGQLVGDASRVILKFDQSVANLASITGKTKSKMDALVTSAREIGKTSAFSAQQVIELQTELAKLGFTEEEIIASSKAIGDFSIALGTDAASAAKLAGATLRGFGLEASESQRVLDSLALSTSTSALDFGRLQISLSKVAPVAAAANIDVERTTALLGVLADRGVEASTSGTSLRNIFLNLADSGMSYNEAMAQINGSTDKLSEATKLFGKEGATTALILAENENSVDNLESSLRGANGTLQEMTDTRLNTLEGKLTLVRSAWEELVLEVDSGNGVFSDFGDSVLTSLTNVLTDLSNINKGWDVYTSALEERRQQQEELNKREEIGLGITRARGGANNSLARTYGQVTDSIKAGIKATKEQIKNSVEGSDEFDNLVDRLSKQKALLAERTQAINVSTEAVEKETEKYKDLNSRLSESNNRIKELTEQYLLSGKTDKDKLAAIKAEVENRKLLNQQLLESITLQSELAGRGQIAAPEAIGPIGLPTSIGSEAPDMSDSISSVVLLGAAYSGLNLEMLRNQTLLQTSVDAQNAKIASDDAQAAAQNELAKRTQATSTIQSLASAQSAKDVVNAARQKIKAYLAEAAANIILREVGSKGLLGLATAGAGVVALNALFDAFVPKLASGAVIPPNNEFLAVLGDQTSGTNIETPERLLRDIVRKESKGGAGEITINLTSEIDGSTLKQLIENVSYEENR